MELLNLRIFSFLQRKNKAGIRAIVLANVENGLTKGQVYPFIRYKKTLRDELNIACDIVEVTNPDHDFDTCLNIDFNTYDVAFIQIRALPRNKREAFLHGLRTKKVLLDSSGNVTFAHELLPLSDVYIGKQYYSDVDLYEEPYWDGRQFADFMTRLYAEKFDLEPSFVSKSGKKSQGIRIPDDQRSKLTVGWNSGTLEHIERRFRKQHYKAPRVLERPIDIHCRLGITTKGAHEKGNWSRWYYFHRQEALEIAESLSNKYNVLAEGYLYRNRTDENTEFEEGGVTFRQIGKGDVLALPRYFKELESSKIVLSPFGMAEICVRDFEAIMAGCLLVKPDMRHVSTEPDIYRPGETYVSCAWDLSDLRETCEYYLEHAEERQRIVNNAVSMYAGYFTETQFVRKIREVLEKIHLI